MDFKSNNESKINIELKAIYADILISSLFCILEWDFEKVKLDFSSVEFSEIEVLYDRIRIQVRKKYKTLGVDLKEGVEKRKLFDNRRKVKVSLVFNYEELSLLIKVLENVRSEFEDDVREFTMVTPGGLGWYGNNGIVLEDIIECFNIMNDYRK